jgi:hypothetical protein
MTKEDFEKSLIEDDQQFYFYVYDDYYSGIQCKNLDKREIYKGYGNKDGKGGETTFFYTSPNSDLNLSELNLNNVFKNKIGLKSRIEILLIENRKQLIEEEKSKKEKLLKEIKRMEILNNEKN